MEELKWLFNAAQTNAPVFVVVALMYFQRYQDRREVRQTQVIAQDDKKEQALIDLLTGFLSGFKDMTERFTSLQEAINTTMTRIAEYIKAHDDRSTSDRKELNTALSLFGANVKLNETKIDALPDKTADKVVTLMSSELDKLKADLPPLVINGFKPEIEQLRADYEASNKKLMELFAELKDTWSTHISTALQEQMEISKAILARLEEVTQHLPQLVEPPAPEVKPEEKPDVS
jgi:hypothetical protein